MANIELVIKMPEEVYKQFIKDQKQKYVSAMISTDIVANGIPLPKGHGRILDEKDILNTFAYDGQYYDLVDMPEYIAGVKEIIEADKAESEDK